MVRPFVTSFVVIDTSYLAMQAVASTLAAGQLVTVMGYVLRCSDHVTMSKLITLSLRLLQLLVLAM